MSFTDFASGFFNSVSNTVNTEINKRNELDFLEKQERIREKLRREAEDRRVAAKTIIQGDTSQGPAQLQVEEYNPSGRLIGTRLATKGEEEKHVMDKQTRAANLAAATSEAEAKTRKEGREELKLQSQLARDKASTAASYASAQSSRAYANNLASPNAKGPETFRDESDFAYLVSAKQGGEALDAEYKQQLATAMADARAMNADEGKLRAVMQELTREYILRAKRLPNKNQE